MSEYNSQIPDVNLTDRISEPEPSRIVAPVDKDTGAVKGKKQGTDGRVKLDESRGFDLTINVPQFKLARARICWRLDATACETVKG